MTPTLIGASPSRARRSRAAAFLAGLCALFVAMTAAAGAPSAKEHELKAAYIFNFARFTTWPTASFPSAKAPLVIGVLGNEQIATALASVMKNHSVNGHPVEVRSLAPRQVIEGLHVLYIGAAQDPNSMSLQQAFRAPGLLTIGETEEFAAAGGTIRFVIQADRLQFEINSSAAQRADLTLSSQLLMLARSVSR